MVFNHNGFMLEWIEFLTLCRDFTEALLSEGVPELFIDHLKAVILGPVFKGPFKVLVHIKEFKYQPFICVFYEFSFLFLHLFFVVLKVCLESLAVWGVLLYFLILFTHFIFKFT